MAKKGRNVARKKRSGGAYSASNLQNDPMPENMDPLLGTVDEKGFYKSSRGTNIVGPIIAAPGTSEDATRINLSKREGDRFERSEYKMPSESGRTISDADRKRIDALVGEIIGGTKKPKPRPDVGAIERGNRAAKRTAQDLSRMKAGGLVGGQVKLDKNKDGKISGADFKMMEDGGEVKGKKRKKSKGNMCRGGGAALRGTKFSGVR